RPRYRPHFAVAAAMLIATMGIGLYAAQRSGFWPAIFPFQWESSPQAVLPTQIAAITQGTAAGAARLQLPRLKFAVASVRPHPQLGPGVTTGLIKCLGVDGLLWSPQNTRDRTPPRQGRCIGPGVPLAALVLTAYASSTIARLAPSQFTAEAPCRRLAGCDIYVWFEAVADNPERVTKGELKLMLQTLLEDRFKARVHHETRELDGYAVTIAKSGIKFKETSSGETWSASGDSHVNGNYTMEQVAKWLSYLLSGVSPPGSMPVLDKTGLTGNYAIKFDLEEILPAGADQAQAGIRSGPGSTAPRQFTTPVPKAVEGELGLHLERAKVPVEFIVIDNLEPPTEN